MFNILIAVSLFYVFILFVVAFGAEKLTDSGRARWLRSPLVYTLSLSTIAPHGLFMAPLVMLHVLDWNI